MRRALPLKLTLVQALLAASLLLLVIAAPASSSGFVTGDGAWQWTNPSPQGNPMKSVSFVNAGTGWAAGVGGTILKTTDGGATWATQVPASSCAGIVTSGCNLNSISFLNATNGLAVGDYGTIWKTVDGGGSWTSPVLPSSGCSGGSCTSTQLNSVKFIDASNAVAVGAGYAFYSSDGGATWNVAPYTPYNPGTPPSVPPTPENGVNPSVTLDSVSMSGATGWAVGSSGSIYKTTDYGHTWPAKQTSPVSLSEIRAVCVVDLAHAYAVSNNQLLRTSDGANWTASGNLSAQLWGVTVSGNNLLATGSGGTILKRTAATNWSDPMGTVGAGMAATASNTTSLVFTAQYVGGSDAFAVGDAGAILKSGDYGANWGFVTGSNSRSFMGSSFINDTTGWAVSREGTVIKTTDAGATWTSDASGIAANTDLQSVQFLDANTGFAVGYSGSAGVLYKYSGGTWTAASLSGITGTGISQLWGIHMVDATHGWAVGFAAGANDGTGLGAVLQTTDGTNWVRSATGIADNYRLYSVDATATTNGWAVGQNTLTGKGIAASYSGGTWTIVEKAELTGLQSIDMVNASTGYAAGYGPPVPPATNFGDGKVYKTTDGGATWNNTSLSTTHVMSAVSFMDANNGYVVGGEGRLFRTTDGGANWTLESTGTGVRLYSLSTVPSTWSASGYAAFVTGDSASVLRSPRPPEVTSVSTAGVRVNPGDAISATFSKDLIGSSISSPATSFTITPQGGPALTGTVAYDGPNRRATFTPASPLAEGTTYTATISTAVTDSSGNHLVQAYSWDFGLPRDYLWTWYDNVNGANWILMANPFGSGVTQSWQLSIGGTPFGLPNNGSVAPGQTITPRYGGVMGGPVDATSMTGVKGIASQRILWAGNSLEEVPGTDAGKLSSHFWWTWYDAASAGYKDWVLVANPSSSETVAYKIKIAGQEFQRGTIPAGQKVTPVFGGIMGGPVEVQAWVNGGSDTNPADARNVMASQRVLSNGGSAFNEVPGIADGDLSSDYLWTWYDNVGGRDWVLIANPATNADGTNNSNDLYYIVTIAGATVDAGGPIAPGQKVTPIYSGWVGGPVEVKTYSDAARTVPQRAIASQRVIWGPSFEEVPGSPASTLATSYHWTWYDQAEGPGVRNWVLVGNPDPSASIYYEVKVAGVLRSAGTLAAGKQVTPMFNGIIGGPVQVSAWDHAGGTPQKVMASQRVLWNGFFNETLGMNLN
ncbi:MAG: Ig-like domain-containing protein [Actinobacteria bacterium]|nr:Ig-like domain-containing protein [Actinomycetota bacterium]